MKCWQKGTHVNALMQVTPYLAYQAILQREAAADYKNNQVRKHVMCIELPSAISL